MSSAPACAGTGFGTVAAVSRSVTKRMSELLPPVLSNEGCIFN